MSPSYQVDGFEIFTVSENQWEQNSYFVIDSAQSSCVAIDPGFGLTGFCQILKQRNIRLDCILATHTHFDHIGGVSVLQKEFGTTSFFFHKSDEKILRQANTYTAFLNEIRVELPTPSGHLNESHPILFGNESIRVMHVPGHTPGGCLLLFKNLIFSGDSLLRPTGKLRRLPGSNEEDLSHSHSRIFGELPMDSLVFPGHGRIRTLSEVKKNLSLPAQEHKNSVPLVQTED